MKTTKRLLVVLIALIFVMGLSPGYLVLAGSDNPYHEGDIQIINSLIMDNDFAFEKNGTPQWEIWKKGVSKPPVGWEGRISWNDAKPKRVIRLKVSGLDHFGSGTVDLRGLDACQHIFINQSFIRGVNVEGLASLESLDLAHNPYLSVVKAKGLTSLTFFSSYTKNRLSSLDLSDSHELKELNCDENRDLTSLNLTNLTRLVSLRISGTSLKSLDVSKMENLQHLSCERCDLAQLTLGKKPHLTDLYCSDNPLETLDLSQTGALVALQCSGAYLTQLSLNKNSARLGWVDLTRNLMKSPTAVTGQDIPWGTSESFKFTPQRKKISLDAGPRPFVGQGDRLIVFKEPAGQPFHFLRLGKVRVDWDDFEIGNNNTTITLREDYLQSLANGTYHFTAVWDGYLASFDLLVDQAPPSPKRSLDQVIKDLMPVTHRYEDAPLFQWGAQGKMYSAIQDQMRVLEDKGIAVRVVAMSDMKAQADGSSYRGIYRVTLKRQGESASRELSFTQKKLVPDTFKDVPQKAWFYGYVENLAEKSIVGGFGTSGEFRPDNKVERQHVAKMVTMAAELPYKGKRANFPDVPKDNPMSPFIAALQEKGAIGGYKDGSFGPTKSVTRAEISVIIAKAFDLKAYGKASSMKDLKGHWAEGLVKILISNGIVKGYADGTFKPNNPVTRAELSKMLTVAMTVSAVQKAEEARTQASVDRAQVFIDILPTNQDKATRAVLQGRLDKIKIK